MVWDLGGYGVGTLVGMSLLFGAFAQLLFWHRATWWVGPLAAVVSFLGGIFISEIWFGWATAKELQPNIDGLSFDEVVLGYLLGAVVVLTARYLARERLGQVHNT